MSIEARLAELTAKHHELDEQITRELAHPSSDDLFISKLKREKLAIKDEINQLEAQRKAS